MILFLINLINILEIPSIKKSFILLMGLSLSVATFSQNVAGCEPSFNNGVLKIEAECYSSTLGEVDLENTTDTGGGQNVGWIDAFDSMIYSIDIPSSGNYRLNYRLASPNGSDLGFNVSVENQIVDTFSVAPTGAWQNWYSETGRIIYLPSGQHNIQLDALDSYMNINWFSLTLVNDPVDPAPANSVVDENEDNWQPIDSAKWFHQTKLPNGSSWFNNEQQHYTNELDNSYVSDGTLKIVAKKQSYTNQGVTKQYTSARLNSKYAFKYGKVEFRAKMPSGSGTWPAVWMLNRNITENGAYWYTQGYGTTPWPASGEIDILEHWGRNPGYAQSAMHTTSSHGGTVNHGGQYVSNIFSDFHTYTMDWDANSIKFYVDDKWHYTYNPSTKNANTWPYDDNFFLLLNIAIEQNIVSSFTQSQMEIDWIRVYHHETNELLWSDEFNYGQQDSDVTDDSADVPPDNGIADNVNDVSSPIDTYFSQSQILRIANNPNAIRNGQLIMDIEYDVSSEDAELTGIGYRIHFDSTMFEFSEINNLLEKNNVEAGAQVEPDTDDFDNNSKTDSFISFSWNSDDEDWPGIELPTNLSTVIFNVDSEAVNAFDYSPIGFSKISGPEGINLISVNDVIKVMPASWDFDTNGGADALTDGLLFLRHSFDLRGLSLTGKAMTFGVNTSGSEIESLLSAASNFTDIDGDGQVDALTDGFLLLRYMFGVRGDSLIEDVISPSATRTTHSQIESYISKHMPDNTTDVIDEVPPQITLIGDATLPLASDVSYPELGAVATDNQDGQITVIITGDVGSAEGSYDITYTATDTAGNSTTETRTVVVDVPPFLTDFELLSANNPELLNDLRLDIQGNTISGRVPQNISFSNLVASFTHNGSTVTVENVEQTNGDTVNDFNELVQYKVSKSNGVSKTYTVNLTKFTGLPIINIQTDGNLPIESKDDYVTGTVTIDGGRGFKDLESTVMKIRGRGNSTWMHPKKPYQMKLDSKEKFLDMPKQKKWIFLAEFSDKTMLRNTLGFELGYLSSLDWTPKAEFAEVYINGDYSGTYNVSEKVEEKSDRVDIGDEGFLLEKDSNIQNRVDPDDVYFNTGVFQDQDVIVIKSPEIDRIDENDFSFEQDSRYIYIKDHINAFETALFGENFTNAETGYQKYIDINSFIDWFLINEIAKNVDSKSFSSIYFTHIPGEKIKMGPLWDFDLGFGNMDYADPEYPEGWWVRYNPWIDRLLDDPAFVTQVKNRFKDHYFANKQYLLDKIDEKAELLKWAQQENFNKWQILGVQVWPNPIDKVFDTYEEEVAYLKEWFDDRMNWLNGAVNSLNGEPSDPEEPISDPENVFVTFQVDMNALDTNAEGVYVAGGDLGQDGYLLTDNGNDVWSVTIELDTNSRYLYKFRNQPSYGTWSGFEGIDGLVAGDCGTGTWSDRYLDVGVSDIILDVVAYGSCTADPY